MKKNWDVNTARRTHRCRVCSEQTEKQWMKRLKADSLVSIAWGCNVEALRGFCEFTLTRQPVWERCERDQVWREKTGINPEVASIWWRETVCRLQLKSPAASRLGGSAHWVGRSNSDRLPLMWRHGSGRNALQPCVQLVTLCRLHSCL